MILHVQEQNKDLIHKLLQFKYAHLQTPLSTIFQLYRGGIYN